MAKSKITKEELLNNCIGLFARKSYHAISIADIAKKCKLATGSIYHYCKSKEDLARQVVLYIKNNLPIKNIEQNHGESYFFESDDFYALIRLFLDIESVVVITIYSIFEELIKFLCGEDELKFLIGYAVFNISGYGEMS